MSRFSGAMGLTIAAMVMLGCNLVPGGGGGVNALDLEPGICFNDTDSEQVGDVPVVACDQAHTNEVFAVLDYPAGTGESFPGTQTLRDYGTTECQGSPFEDYVGLDYPSSDFLTFTITPSEGTWADGDREIVCALYLPGNEPITGSVRGSGR